MKAALRAWLRWDTGGNKVHALGFQIKIGSRQTASRITRGLFAPEPPVQAFRYPGIRPDPPRYWPSVKTTLTVVSTSVGWLSSLYGL